MEELIFLISTNKRSLTWFYFRLEEEASSDENDSDDGSDDNSGSEDASSSSSESSSSSGYAMYYFSNANQCYYVYFCKVHIGWYGKGGVQLRRAM